MHLINPAPPLTMFVDLNSAFATTEQQAHPSLRGRPMGVTNRIHNYACIIACSYEAKALGIKVGMRMNEALKLCPNFVLLETDPAKYHHVYRKILKIMQSYTPNVAMKSIDEGVMKFDTIINLDRSLSDIGYEIKRRVRSEIGNHMSINVGIGTNQFLAKQAAGWHKPDGLDILDHTNLLDYYQQIKLTDLTGIAKRWQARLQAVGIFTPVQFFETSLDRLRCQVFHSVLGEDWYNRLHGYEVDGNPTHKRQVGRQFVLDIKTNDPNVVLPRFHYLCETVGKKLRSRGLDARGITTWAVMKNGNFWKYKQAYKYSFYSDRDIYNRALWQFNQRPLHLDLHTIGITCYLLSTTTRTQTDIFDPQNRKNQLTTAIDQINKDFGLFKIHSASSLEGVRHVKQKIPFGSTEYFDLLLK